MWGLEAPVHKTGTPGPKAQDYYIAIRIWTNSIRFDSIRYDCKTGRGIHTPAGPILEANAWNNMDSNEVNKKFSAYDFRVITPNQGNTAQQGQ